jgi:hypothetical protein
MSWKQQKVISALALAAALAVNCWPLQSPAPSQAQKIAAAP